MASQFGVSFIHDSQQQCEECPHKCQHMAANPGDIAADIWLEMPAGAQKLNDIKTLDLQALKQAHVLLYVGNES